MPSQYFMNKMDMLPAFISPTYAPLQRLQGPRCATTAQERYARFLRRTPRPRQNTSALQHSRACLSPPNAEVDWVIVDVAVDGFEEESGSSLIRSTEDDAKTLVRTVLRDAPVELSVMLTSDAKMRNLNSKWRGMDCATDVLSFPQDDPDQVVLGDIVISVETARRQATEAGLEEQDEIRILLLHGLLHLIGYDHVGKTEGDWLVMAQMENRVMKQLGWKGEGLVSAAQQDPFYKDIVQA